LAPRLDHITLHGSGDAFTTYRTIYITDSRLRGDVDTVLGYAEIYWINSEIDATGPVTYTRTPEGSHGNIFINCTIIGLDLPLPWTITPSDPAGEFVDVVFSRLPDNGNGTQRYFPYAETVFINAKTENIALYGWGPIAPPPFNTSQVHLWEYNTMDLQGNPVDTSQRVNISKEVKLPEDSKTIEDYSTPEFVLKGWKPVVIPKTGGLNRYRV
jgi:pectinesterase